MRTIKCKYCGEGGFTWKNLETIISPNGAEVKTKWRLIDKDGKIHSCGSLPINQIEVETPKPTYALKEVSLVQEQREFEKEVELTDLRLVKISKSKITPIYLDREFYSIYFNLFCPECGKVFSLMLSIRADSKIGDKILVRCRECGDYYLYYWEKFNRKKLRISKVFSLEFIRDYDPLGIGGYVTDFSEINFDLNTSFKFREVVGAARAIEIVDPNIFEQEQKEEKEEKEESPVAPTSKVEKVFGSRITRSITSDLVRFNFSLCCPSCEKYFTRLLQDKVENLDFYNISEINTIFVKCEACKEYYIYRWNNVIGLKQSISKVYIVKERDPYYKSSWKFRTATDEIFEKIRENFDLTEFVNSPQDSNISTTKELKRISEPLRRIITFD